MSDTVTECRPTHTQRQPARLGRAPYVRDLSVVFGLDRRPSRADLTPVDPARIAAWQLAQARAHAAYERSIVFEDDRL